jgi:hypothetical protein
VRREKRNGTVAAGVYHRPEGLLPGKRAFGLDQLLIRHEAEKQRQSDRGMALIPPML